MQDRTQTTTTPLVSYLKTSVSHKQTTHTLSLSLNVKADKNESFSLLAMKKLQSVVERQGLSTFALGMKHMHFSHGQWTNICQHLL